MAISTSNWLLYDEYRDIRSFIATEDGLKDVHELFHIYILHHNPADLPRALTCNLAARTTELKQITKIQAASKKRFLKLRTGTGGNRYLLLCRNQLVVLQPPNGPPPNPITPWRYKHLPKLQIGLDMLTVRLPGGALGAERVYSVESWSPWGTKWFRVYGVQVEGPSNCFLWMSGASGTILVRG